MRAFLLILIIAFQAVEFRDLKGHDGIQTAENRFTGVSFIRTKPMSVTGSVGKGSFFDRRAQSAEMTLIAVTTLNNQPPHVTLIISPRALTFAGRLRADADDGRQFYIPFDSHFRALIDNQPVDLGVIVKADDYNVFGHYDGAGMVAVSLDTFKKLVKADRFELAVGTIELKLYPQLRNRLKNLHLAITDYRQP